MQIPRAIFALSALLVILAAFVLPRAHGTEAVGNEAKVERVEKRLQMLLKALIAGDYPAFLAPGTKDLSERISEHRFAVMREDAVPALKNGYAVVFDIEVVAQDGTKSYHWKIIPRKGDAELLAILTLKGGQVYNLSVQ